MRHGFAVFAGIDPDVIVASATEAERLGYASFWVNHPGKIDGLAALARPARDTRVLDLGVGVIPLHTRDPQSIATGVTANGLPPGRLLVGVGSPNPNALGRVRDGIAALRQTVAARLVVAALGPKMCRLAGEIADGVLFNWLTPEHARRSADLVREGASAARRTTPAIYAYVRVAIGAAGRARLAEESARYAAIPAYAAHFGRMGVKPEVTCVAVDDAAAVPGALAAWEGALDELVVRAIPGSDTIDDHLAVLRAAKPTSSRTRR